MLLFYLDIGMPIKWLIRGPRHNTVSNPGIIFFHTLLIDHLLAEFDGCAVHEQFSCTTDNTRGHITNVDNGIGPQS